ncbi:DNA polymerase III subunit gamma and tau [Motilibacter deserti]|uniref:DNA polymerase III subunit gamma/tau n=1 Tax=Motilibacter deserti TaxID=2714956 RepID=A0ABX0GWQ1_9ACTN|nr:DNA polymerase III subunit gamma and tau [Motilibacter deserti]
MSQALYRRYRPETFADVIGQEHVTGPLGQALRKGHINHAYLFSGPRGCGKTTSARILARCLNCEQGPTPTPCGVCDSCVALARGGPGSIDVIEIDAASHGGVDDARDLRDKAFFAPASSRFKVYIVDEAHMVSTQGFNALLKVVEEPPEHVKFVFATTEPEKVIGTIRSRTHHYPFRLVPPTRLQEHLASICEREGVGVEKGVLPLVVRAGRGSVRDALSVLDQLVGGAGPEGVTYALATALLGFTDASLLDATVDAFAAGDGAAVFTMVDRVIEGGLDPRRFAEDLLERLRDLIILDAVPDSAEALLSHCPPDQLEAMRAQAGAFGGGALSRAADILSAGLTEMRGTTAPRLQLELMCARVLLPAAEGDERSLAARLDRLERRVSGGPMPPPTPLPAAPEPAAPGARGPERPVPARPAAESPVAHAAPSAAGASAAPGVSSAPAAPSADAPEWPAPQPVGPDRTAEREDERSAARATGDRPTGERAAQSPGHERPAAALPGAGPAAQAPAEHAPAAYAPAPPTAPAAAAPGAPAAGGIDLAGVRGMWPVVLTTLAGLKRTTWSLVAQNATVAGLADNRLTLAFATAGLRDRFSSRGDHEEFVRQALIDVLGVDWRVEAIVGGPGDGPPASSPRAAAPAAPPQAPAPGPVPAPGAGPAGGYGGGQAGGYGSGSAGGYGGGSAEGYSGGGPVAPAPAGPGGSYGAGGPATSGPANGGPPPTNEAGRSPGRQALAAAAAAAPPPRTPTVPPEQDTPAADDPDLEDSGLSGVQLLQRDLGARVIEEYDTA